MWAAHLGESPALSIGDIADRLGASSPHSFASTVRFHQLIAPYRETLRTFDPVGREGRVMTTATSATRRVRQPAAEGAPTPEPTGKPACPKCGGPMWDNRDSKRNPRAPDFRCRNRMCDGVLWPGQHRVAVPIIARAARVGASGNGAGDGEAPSRSETKGNGGNGLSALRRCYLDVTEFVLSDVREA
ncbi:MAG: hypothetical protein ACREMW_05230 [Gemmatimonadales bacterium]